MQHPNTWIIATLGLALLAGLVVWSAHRRRSQRRELPVEWALTSRPVFSADERRFHRQLCVALPEYAVLAKLPLVRFCQPSKPREVRYWYELLGSIHVSFAICSHNGRVLAAVDVEGERGSRRAAQIKQAVLTACRIRYLRCAPDQLPSVPELQQLVPALMPTVRTSGMASPVNETRDKLASTVATRRQQRANLWQDSTFGADMPLPTQADSFVVEPPPSPLRH